MIHFSSPQVLFLELGVFFLIHLIYTDLKLLDVFDMKAQRKSHIRSPIIDYFKTYAHEICYMIRVFLEFIGNK